MNCEKGPSSDKQGFANLVKELRAAFRPRGLSVSAAVSASKRVIDAGKSCLINGLTLTNKLLLLILSSILCNLYVSNLHKHIVHFILAYDVATLSKNLDWISLMTYDYHGQWDKKTGHLSPMYEGEDDEDKTLNTVRTARSKMFEISIINVQKTDTCYLFHRTSP